MFYRIGRTNCCSIASRSLIRSVVISRRPYSASSLMNQSFTSSHEMSEKRNVFRVFQRNCSAQIEEMIKIYRKGYEFMNKNDEDSRKQAYKHFREAAEGPM